MQNEQLTHNAKSAEKSAGAISVLQSQLAALEKENSLLRSQLMQFGLDVNNAVQQSAGARSVPLAQALLQQCAPQASYIPAVSTGNHNQMATNQLLASLAQNLASSNSSLLSSVAQQVMPTTSMLSMPQLSSSQLTPTPPNASPQIPQLGVLHNAQNASMTQSVPLINLLVQTLASFANTAPPLQANSLPRIAMPQFHPQMASQSNLSAAAAATLLNTILVANMLGGGGTPSSHGDSGSGGIGSSVLNSVDHQGNPDKK